MRNCLKTNNFVMWTTISAIDSVCAVTHYGRPLRPPVSSKHHQHARREQRMIRSRDARAKGFFRQAASGAFDQYLQDIQKLPLITRSRRREAAGAARPEG